MTNQTKPREQFDSLCLRLERCAASFTQAPSGSRHEEACKSQLFAAREALRAFVAPLLGGH